MCVESESLNSVWLVSCVARPIVLKVLIDAVVDSEEYSTGVCMWLVLAFAMVVLAESILQVCDCVQWLCSCGLAVLMCSNCARVQ